MTQKFYTGVIKKLAQGDDAALYVTIECSEMRGRKRRLVSYVFWAQGKIAERLLDWIAVSERWALNIETTTGEIVGISAPAQGDVR